MYSNNKLSWWLYLVGVFIVLGTHLYMFAYGLQLDEMNAHAMLNLFAGILLISGWLSRKA